MPGLWKAYPGTRPNRRRTGVAPSGRRAGLGEFREERRKKTDMTLHRSERSRSWRLGTADVRRWAGFWAFCLAPAAGFGCSSGASVDTDVGAASQAVKPDPSVATSNCSDSISTD